MTKKQFPGIVHFIEEGVIKRDGHKAKRLIRLIALSISCNYVILNCVILFNLEFSIT